MLGDDMESISERLAGCDAEGAKGKRIISCLWGALFPLLEVTVNKPLHLCNRTDGACPGKVI